MSLHDRFNEHAGHSMLNAGAMRISGGHGVEGVEGFEGHWMQGIGF